MRKILSRARGREAEREREQKEAYEKLRAHVAERCFRQAVIGYSEKLNRILNGEDPYRVLTRKDITILLRNGMLITVGNRLLLPARVIAELRNHFYREKKKELLL